MAQIHRKGGRYGMIKTLKFTLFNLGKQYDYGKEKAK